MREYVVVWVFLVYHTTNRVAARIPQIPNEINIKETDSIIIETPLDLMRTKHQHLKPIEEDFNVDYSVEERIDENEFIFIKGKQNLVLHDLLGLDNSKVDSTSKTFLRIKRSSNIILEENLATTLSGFQYTGRDTKLNNEMHFNNINS